MKLHMDCMLDFRKANFSKLRTTRSKATWQTILTGIEIQDGLEFLTKKILKAQLQIIQTRGKSGRQKNNNMMWLHKKLSEGLKICN